MNLLLNIACDDVNPSPNYRLIGTPAEKWFWQLHNEFGVKFDIFCPSNYHGKWRVSEHKNWVDELRSIPFININAHGHFHSCTDSKSFGEMEFAEIKNVDVATERIKMIYDEWGTSLKMGWRSPGWICSYASKLVIEKNFQYVALHYTHNLNLDWNCKKFFGHDGIDKTELTVHNGNMIMIQSHIFGDHNYNVWNEHNYNNIRNNLRHLFDNFKITPKLLKEC